MTSAITNPLHPEIMQSIRGANVIMGHDPECMDWIANYRAPAAEGDGRRRRRSRRRG